MTNAAPTTLYDLVSYFELPRPDAEFPDLIVSLVEEAKQRAAALPPLTKELNAKYFYLLARAYELLGYFARHTPWLSNSPRFYWHKALGFLEEAWLLAETDSSIRYFLHGKLLFRRAMTFTLNTKVTDPGDDSLDLLAQAEREFSKAAELERDSVFYYLCSDAALTARTEREQRAFRRELQDRIARAAKRPFPPTLDAVAEHLATFPEQARWDFPSETAGMRWPVQHALAKVRPRYAKAQMLVEELVAFIADTQKKNRDWNFGAVLLETSETESMERHEQAATVCDEVGLAIRAADSRVTMLVRKAEISLRHCLREFHLAQARDDEERSRLIDGAVGPPAVLGPESLVGLKNIRLDNDPIRAPHELLDEARKAEVPLDPSATVFAESDGNWIVRSGRDRYLVQAAGDIAEIVNLEKQPIPFSNGEAQIFYKFSRTVEETCRLYTLAIREILRLLERANVWYDQTTSHLIEGKKVAPNDAHLASLYSTVNSIQKEVRARNYPLLTTLRVRTRYAWSLLEMFQMRNQSVRLGTLFSGQCQLVMKNPFFEAETDVREDEYLEVGADPIFQTTIDFVFGGAKGETNRHDFQRRALGTTRATIDQQERSLLIESRYLDLYPDTRRALIARLACHRNLALALEQFTDVYVAQRAGELPTATINRSLKDIQLYFTAAKEALEASGDYQSKLIDAMGLDALHDYMKGIARVLIGMNARQRNRLWDGDYRNALDLFVSARKKLRDAGDAYLLPRDVRDDYINYVDARILTVTAFRHRYLGEQGNDPADYASAAECFEQSAEIFETLHDYRVATKARARAADVRSLSETAAEARYQWLKEANALYAACADEAGYKDTYDRLQDEFSDEEAGLFFKKSGVQRPRVSTPPASPPFTTREKFGSFELEPIGHGGMADVYRARLKDGSVVALKRVNRQYRDNDEYRKRFQREFETAKALTHANIVAVYEFGEIGNIPYFTMEYLEGNTLDVPVKGQESFAPRRAAKIARQIAEALGHAHGKGVFHRDLTPSNVMILQSDRVKIMDFGVARDRRFERITKPEEVLGTPLYAAPEYLKGGEASASSDFYALGAILYELLTAKPILEPTLRLVQDQPPPSRTLPDLLPTLDAIVVKLLARNVAERYGSAETLITDLDLFLQEMPDHDG